MRVTPIRRAQIEPFDPAAPSGAIGLSRRGRVQARLLGTRLATPEPPSAVYTGESDRHQATADLVAETIDAIADRRPAVEVEPGLNDIAWTPAALETCVDEELSQAAWRDRWIAGDLAIDETVDEVRERVTGVVGRLRSRHDADAHLLLVTSAVPVLVLVCDALATPVASTDLVIANAAVTDLSWDADSRTAQTINDVGHLPGGLVTRDGFVGRA